MYGPMLEEMGFRQVRQYRLDSIDRQVIDMVFEGQDYEDAKTRAETLDERIRLEQDKEYRILT